MLCCVFIFVCNILIRFLAVGCLQWPIAAQLYIAVMYIDIAFRKL